MAEMAREPMTVPKSAMPIVMPLWRRAFNVAEAEPLTARGTAAMAAAPVAGTASPRPTPSTVKKQATTT